VKLGVLVNARAGRPRRDPALVSRLAGLLPPGRVAASASPEEVPDALDRLRAEGVDLLALVGGDGTVGGTLTELLHRWPELELPALMLTPGGTVNTIARSLGARGRPEELVRRLAAGAPLRTDSRRPLVRTRSAEGSDRTGMIFANGVAVRWLRMYYEESRHGPLGAASVVARIVGSAALRGPLARSLFETSGVCVEVDDAPIPLARFTAMAASSVRHIGLGFRPFTTAGRDPERFHFTITEASAARISLELPAARFGRTLRSSCLRHYPARHVRLRFDEPQPWSVDADVFPPTRELELRATRPLRFVAP
jgi:diacylglycerol kinase family enzyme